MLPYIVTQIKLKNLETNNISNIPIRVFWGHRATTRFLLKLIFLLSLPIS